MVWHTVGRTTSTALVIIIVIVIVIVAVRRQQYWITQENRVSVHSGPTA
ncbi:hypothetical protein H5P30_09340 [Puniceicoccus vermicola]|uniref:Uncharacterized protein n=1 Tax=Puniceicoccus vermicola TaxID=388746 RepID=A0A7X1E4E8_9BACT|nr:hypothetical protein [Puniceicoccus vermicola]